LGHSHAARADPARLHPRHSAPERRCPHPSARKERRDAFADWRLRRPRSTWLPDAMKRFQDVCKGKTLELHIWNPTFLLDTMERGEFDMVIGCRCRGDHGGRVLW